mmetsp:Transcript_20681/g.25399  ORF Transcript_20681/g.25399 Transcript_20681/m.25399 type:complete len:688 (-) Transcript_20681:110-2173(-)|eukprot:CAMPEP_0194380918 /NCGR_PEP_ID=MMETSP0174-20130528/48759_1 /TAXON_ID=216777 /ORGANISM="Proboscia alata, Strain PI-D3" /LENGTH=687 /DNA_ID=CAMNT_0039164755 /DNA_START=40 /DNA_END=2103 /DNA_ORIENTATION=+
MSSDYHRYNVDEFSFDTHSDDRPTPPQHQLQHNYNGEDERVKESTTPNHRRQRSKTMVSRTPADDKTCDFSEKEIGKSGGGHTTRNSPPLPDPATRPRIGAYNKNKKNSASNKVSTNAFHCTDGGDEDLLNQPPSDDAIFARSNWNVSDTCLETISLFQPPLIPHLSTFVGDSSPSVVSARISDLFRRANVLAIYDDVRAVAEAKTPDNLQFTVELYRASSAIHSHGIIVTIHQINNDHSDPVRFHSIYAKSILMAARGDHCSITKQPNNLTSTSYPKRKRSLLCKVVDIGSTSNTAVERRLLEAAVVALERVRGLLCKDRIDAQILGMECLCLLTEPSHYSRKFVQGNEQTFGTNVINDSHDHNYGVGGVHFETALYISRVVLSRTIVNRQYGSSVPVISSSEFENEVHSAVMLHMMYPLNHNEGGAVSQYVSSNDTIQSNEEDISKAQDDEFSDGKEKLDKMHLGTGKTWGVKHNESDVILDANTDSFDCAHVGSQNVKFLHSKALQIIFNAVGIVTQSYTDFDDRDNVHKRRSVSVSFCNEMLNVNSPLTQSTFVNCLIQEIKGITKFSNSHRRNSTKGQQHKHSEKLDDVKNISKTKETGERNIVKHVHDATLAVGILRAVLPIISDKLTQQQRWDGFDDLEIHCIQDILHGALTVGRRVSSRLVEEVDSTLKQLNATFSSPD